MSRPLQNFIWDELVAEYPPLWNPRDLHYRDRNVRAQCKKQLLEKCNQMSSIPITMESVMQKVRNVNRRRLLRRSLHTPQGFEHSTPLTPASQTAEPTSTNTESTEPSTDSLHFRELVTAYPCLWDSEDIHFMDKSLKAKCMELLLVKYNNLTQSPITMTQLHKKLHQYRIKLYKQRNENEAERRPVIRMRRFEELATEYPCLWDPNDPDFTSRSGVRDRSMRQLLDKYNSVSSERINCTQLMKKINLLRRRQKRRKPPSQAASGEDSRADWLSGTSSDSTDPVNRIQNNVQSSLSMTQTSLLSIVFHCCAVCGEVKTECLDNNDKPYIENNKTKLTINNESVELNYDKDATICQNCDNKLQEMHEFVKLIKTAQDKINCLKVADVIAVDDDDEDDNASNNFRIDSLAVTETEIVNPTSCKRSSEETPELRKKCRVTIDLNSCDDDENTMDDIAKYRMFNNDVSGNSKNADGTHKVLVTENDTLYVKQDTEIDEVGETSTDNYRSSIVSERVSAVEEVETGKIVKEEEIRNDINGISNIVTEEDKRNDVKDEHANNSEIANDAASVASVVAGKEPMCVIPKSELVLLVESIVSRMMNK